MTDVERDAIQVHNSPVFWQAALTPGFKLLGQCLVEATDGAGTGSNSQQGLSHFPHLMRAHPGHEHLRQPFGDVRLVATIALKDLRVELTFPIAWNLEIFDAASRCGQIAAIVAIAIAFALGAAFPPSHANDRIEI